jgi:hypothetical protein
MGNVIAGLTPQLRLVISGTSVTFHAHAHARPAPLSTVTVATTWAIAPPMRTPSAVLSFASAAKMVNKERPAAVRRLSARLPHDLLPRWAAPVRPSVAPTSASTAAPGRSHHSAEQFSESLDPTTAPPRKPRAPSASRRRQGPRHSALDGRPAPRPWRPRRARGRG